MSYVVNLGTCFQVFTWVIAEPGARWVTSGVPGGEWHLRQGDGLFEDMYVLCPVDCARGVEIRAEHGLYSALDQASEYIEQWLKEECGSRRIW